VGDPALASPDGVDAIRHDIEGRVRELLATLTD
jgi:ArsR family transcriptional regulator